MSVIEVSNESGETNHLFPVFLKLEKFNVLIVGGGKVALEKLKALLQNTPSAKIKLVASEFSGELTGFANGNPNLSLVEREYNVSDLNEVDFLLVAVNNRELSGDIYHQAREKGILSNVADTPEYCDFYLGSVVQKGNLKIAISTNGKSPTLAKRLREVFNELLPAHIDDTLNNLHVIRKKLKGDFATKVSRLHAITNVLAVED